MKRILFLAILFMSACAPAPTPTSGTDPNIALAVAGAQLTGTAQAWSMQQQAWTVTAQSWTPTPSLTPVPTSTPTITFTPTVDVTGTMAVEMMNAQVTQIALENKRAETTNMALAWLPYVIAALALALASFIGYVGARRLAIVPTPIHDVTGKPMPMLDVIEGVAWESDRTPNGMAVLNRKYVASLPVITEARQAEVTNRAQLVDLQSRRARLPRELVNSQSVEKSAPLSQLPAGNEAQSGLFPLPAWDLVNGWQGEKNILPFGMTATGLGLVNVDQFPHMATIGKTGEGKSRRFFRPLIACALAAGHRVVVVGKTTDYMVFAAHPNMTIVKVSQMTQPEHAARYVSILKALVEEMNRRDDYLTGVNRSTWAQAGRERTFIVLDELGNAMRLMPSGLAEEVRTWVEGLVSEGRKVGFNVAIANQRATGMAGILSQTGKAIFRVERDEERAHRSLQGASNLHEGYFYARFGDVRLAGAFEPSDEELTRFLASRPAQPLERDWVDGRIVDTFSAALPTAPEQTLLTEAPATPTAQPKSDIEKLAETIRGDWHPNMSGRQVAALLGKSYAGWWKDKTDEIIAVLKNQNLEGETA